MEEWCENPITLTEGMGKRDGQMLDTKEAGMLDHLEGKLSSRLRITRVLDQQGSGPAQPALFVPQVD